MTSPKLRRSDGRQTAAIMNVSRDTRPRGRDKRDATMRTLRIQQRASTRVHRPFTQLPVPIERQQAACDAAHRHANPRRTAARRNSTTAQTCARGQRPLAATMCGQCAWSLLVAQRDSDKRIASHARPARTIGYPRMSASGESSTTMHRLLHASGSHPIPPPDDHKTNQYNQDLGLIHSTNGNHLESPNEGSSIDHQVTIYLHAQNITMFPTNETWYFASQILVSSSGGLILILTAQSTRNMFRIHNPKTLALIPLLGNHGGSGSRLPARQRKNKNCRETINTAALDNVNPVHDQKRSSACTRRSDEIGADGFSSSRLAGTISGGARRRRLLERRGGGHT
ncbi:hypothetical protein F511_41133 [Dorcoceras hygrometricum]|uniref:Uncharacterized protein n=1 Tax=Dorcoceras hygrometricum TaxID=472368 RepID=A0A2Z7CSQ3_9LAMI|nr:hypothetical protein F511_41133 [Dorcoceras hygrometricum]